MSKTIPKSQRNHVICWMAGTGLFIALLLVAGMLTLNDWDVDSSFVPTTENDPIEAGNDQWIQANHWGNLLFITAMLLTSLYFHPWRDHKLSSIALLTWSWVLAGQCAGAGLVYATRSDNPQNVQFFWNDDGWDILQTAVAWLFVVVSSVWLLFAVYSDRIVGPLKWIDAHNGAAWTFSVWALASGCFLMALGILNFEDPKPFVFHHSFNLMVSSAVALASAFGPFRNHPVGPVLTGMMAVFTAGQTMGFGYHYKDRSGLTAQSFFHIRDGGDCFQYMLAFIIFVANTLAYSLGSVGAFTATKDTQDRAAQHLAQELPVIADEGPLTEIKAVPEAAPQRPAADIPGKTTGNEGDPSTRTATKEEAAHFDPLSV
ncbi:unnamed protein product [Vitrella brassicaformis CCMP3155]|uniref:Uncharacterized protein n=1 Tax=Vitrella brassicaformis (strain CCMP3155) TaxID=1169540 RepID=A0A0G4FK10_VITBC|nr:unnamed protein product [Vitrella brassicaformis CCMP3155]|eukprot:CEM14112.1 unnamed protein product [Vitrella brassicaformis CCMP3155]